MRFHSRTILSLPAVAPESRGAVFRLLPILLSAKRAQIEEVVSSADRLPATTVGGVSVEDLVAVPDKAAQSRQIEGLLTLEVVGCSSSFMFSLGPIVVLQRSDRFVERHVKVIVEIAAE